MCLPGSVHDYQSQLKALGHDVTGNRGKMLHLILTICQKVEKAFNKIVDGGEGGEGTPGSASKMCIYAVAGYSPASRRMTGSSMGQREACNLPLSDADAGVAATGATTYALPHVDTSTPLAPALLCCSLSALAPGQVVSACWRCLT
jgi:hypothetical protein